MEQRDLDLELKRKRYMSLVNVSLDNINTVIVDRSDMKTAIYNMIDVEVQGMRTEGTYHYKEFAPISMQQDTFKEKCKEFLKKVDRRLQKDDFYRMKLRETLKKIYNYFNPSMTINMLKVLKLDNEDMVVKTYENIFCRRPDVEGLQHNVDLIENGSLNKYDLFMLMYRSDENIIQKRLKWKLTARLIYKR